MDNTDSLLENSSSSAASSAQGSVERRRNIVLTSRADVYPGVALAPPHSNLDILARHVAASEAIHNEQIHGSNFGNTLAALSNIDSQTHLLLLQQPSLLGAATSNDDASNLAIAAQHRALELHQRPLSNILSSPSYPTQRAGERASATIPQPVQLPNRSNTSRMSFGGNSIDDELLWERASGIGSGCSSDSEQIRNALLLQSDHQYLLAFLQLQQRQQMQREGSNLMQLEDLLRASSSATTVAGTLSLRGMESGGFGMGQPSSLSSTSHQISTFLSQMREVQLLQQLRTDEALRSEATAMEHRHLLMSQVARNPSMSSLTEGAGLRGARTSRVPLFEQSLRLQSEGGGSPLLSLDQQRALPPFYNSYQDHVRHGAKRRAEYIQMKAQTETSKRSLLPANKDLKIYPSQNISGLDSISSRTTSSLSQDALPPTTKESNDQKISGKPKAKTVDETISIETFPHTLYRMLNEIEEEGNAHIVSFFPHGCSFGIHKRQEFVNIVLPKYFTTGRMSSFQRQLNLYNFHRITNGPEKGGYWQENFIKDCPLLCKRITRKKITSKPPTNPTITSIQAPPESTTAAAAAMMSLPFTGTAAAALRQIYRYGSSLPSIGSIHPARRQRPTEGINDSNIVANAISQLLAPEQLHTRHQLEQTNQSGALNEQQFLSSLLLADNTRSTAVINTSSDRDLIQVLLQQLMVEQGQQRQRQQRDNETINNPE